MQKQVEFSESVLVPKIISANKELQKLKLIKAQAESNSQIDGFMGNIIFLTLQFENSKKEIETRRVVVKLMKPGSALRDLVLAEIQFTNEVYIYNTVITTFLNKFSKNFITIDKDLWCPRTYLAEVGKYPELSDQVETLLVLENLAPRGYRLGNRINLTVDELMLMTKAIAQYHACTYAMRILKDPELETLIAGIIPLGFERTDGRSLYDILYKIALKRLFEYLDNKPEELDSEKFQENILIFRKRYENSPLKLMERFRRIDETFSVILHGDYNRNNVLFKYDNVNGNEIPIDLRFIDFQEVRYGTPAMDLAFFMYMNMPPELLKTDLFERLLKNYHFHLIEALCELLHCQKEDDCLEIYSYDNFYNHFRYFAFYGAMVSVHFVPWMACPEEQCEQLAALFEKDMDSTEFKNLAMICGGKEVNKRITEVVRHASNMGFMDMIGNDDQ